MTKQIAARDTDLARPSPAWMFLPMLPVLALVILIAIAVANA